MGEYIDKLTGLYNLFYLKDNYNNYLINDSVAYLISIDFTKLKYINDNYGHSLGDLIIKLFANITTDIFKESLVVRRSGDEFVIFSPLTKQQIIINLEQIIKEIKKAYDKKIIPIEFSFNSGIKMCESDFDETLFKSDITMYEAKRNNKLYEIYTCEILYNLEKQINFIENIDKAVKEDMLQHSYQKIYDINGKSSKITQIYTRDNHGNSIFTNKKMNTLKTNYRLGLIDLYNVQKAFDELPTNSSSDYYMINIFYSSLFSTECNIINYLQKLKDTDSYNLKNIIISINVNGNNRPINKLVNKIEELKNIGVKICIDNLNFSKCDSVIPLISTTDINYVNIDKKFLVKAMNEKKYKIVLETLTSLFIKLNITPIFINIDNESELKFIKNINNKSLIRGYIYSSEQLKNSA